MRFKVKIWNADLDIFQKYNPWEKKSEWDSFTLTKLF